MRSGYNTQDSLVSSRPTCPNTSPWTRATTSPLSLLRTGHRVMLRWWQMRFQIESEWRHSEGQSWSAKFHPSIHPSIHPLTFLPSFRSFIHSSLPASQSHPSLHHLPSLPLNRFLQDTRHEWHSSRYNHALEFVFFFSFLFGTQFLCVLTDVYSSISTLLPFY